MIAFSLEISQPKTLLAFPHLMMSFPWRCKLMKVGGVSLAHFQCPIFWYTDLISRAFHYNLCRSFYKCTNQDILHMYFNVIDTYRLFARVNFVNSPRCGAFLPSSVNVCSRPSHFQECLVPLHPCCVCPPVNCFLVQLN